MQGTETQTAVIEQPPKKGSSDVWQYVDWTLNVPFWFLFLMAIPVGLAVKAIWKKLGQAEAERKEMLANQEKALIAFAESREQKFKYYEDKVDVLQKEKDDLEKEMREQIERLMNERIQAAEKISQANDIIMALQRGGTSRSRMDPVTHERRQPRDFTAELQTLDGNTQNLDVRELMAQIVKAEREGKLKL